jgi:hypothetical protein
MRQSLFVGSSPDESESIMFGSQGDFLFVGSGHNQSWGHRGGAGQGGIPQGGAREFPRGDPNVPVADCVRRNLQPEIDPRTC